MYESSEINLELKRLKLKIMSMSPYEFETYIAKLFENIGYDVEQTPASNDGGKDIILKNGQRKYYVECKHFSIGNFVGREILQKAVGAAVVDSDVDACILVTTSLFNSNALDIAGKSHNMPIFLLDLEDILDLSMLNAGEDVFDNGVLLEIPDIQESSPSRKTTYTAPPIYHCYSTVANKERIKDSRRNWAGRQERKQIKNPSKSHSSEGSCQRQHDLNVKHFDSWG